MPERNWPETWRAWLRARFGERLEGDALEAAVQSCEQLRALWEPLLAAQEDIGERPFSHLLPPLRGPEGS